jgi:hypothetical protein
MQETNINKASGNGRDTPFVIEEIHEYISNVIATSGSMQKVNSYNMQMKSFVQCIQQDQKIWNMIIDMPHGNKAYLTCLKNVEFVVEAFTSRMNAEHINIGTFAPQDEMHFSVVNIKDNMENLHMDSELGNC